MHTINAIGQELDRATANALTANAVDAGALDLRTANIITAAISDQALRPVPPAYRDTVRASVYKYMLFAVLRSL